MKWGQARWGLRETAVLMVLPQNETGVSGNFPPPLAVFGACGFTCYPAILAHR